MVKQSPAILLVQIVEGESPVCLSPTDHVWLRAATLVAPLSWQAAGEWKSLMASLHVLQGRSLAS